MKVVKHAQALEKELLRKPLQKKIPTTSRYLEAETLPPCDLSLTFKEPMLLSLGCTVACLLDRRPSLFDKLGKMRCARTRSIDLGMQVPGD